MLYLGKKYRMHIFYLFFGVLALSLFSTLKGEITKYILLSFKVKGSLPAAWQPCIRQMNIWRTLPLINIIKTLIIDISDEELNQNVIQEPVEDVVDVHYKDERTDSEPGKNGKNLS